MHLNHSTSPSRQNMSPIYVPEVWPQHNGTGVSQWNGRLAVGWASRPSSSFLQKWESTHCIVILTKVGIQQQCRTENMSRIHGHDREEKRMERECVDPRVRGDDDGCLRDDDDECLRRAIKGENPTSRRARRPSHLELHT